MYTLTEEAVDDALTGPAYHDMPLKDPKRPGFVQCYDPCTLQRLGQVKAMTAEDVNEVVRRAAVAQKQWCKTSFAERRRVLQCIQRYMLTHQDEICRVASRDSGKPRKFGLCICAVDVHYFTGCTTLRVILQAWTLCWARCSQQQKRSAASVPTVSGGSSLTGDHPGPSWCTRLPM